MVWKGEAEKKYFMSSNCSGMQQKHARCWPGGHSAIIVSNTMPDKALVPKNTLASHWYGKINAWILYRRHFRQNGNLHKDQKFLLQLSLALLDALIISEKVNPSSSRGPPSKRRSLKEPSTGKKPTRAYLVTDVCFHQFAHCPSPTINKYKCRLCRVICRM